MAKKRRFTNKETTEQTPITKTEAEAMAAGAGITKEKKKSKEPSVGYSMKIPAPIYKRLQTLTEQTGYSKASIIVRGLVAEMDKMDNKG